MSIQVKTSVVFVETDDSPKWEHAVQAAVMRQEGSIEPLDGASRLRLIEAIRSQGYPHAVLDYVPPEVDSLPRIFVRPRSRS